MIEVVHVRDYYRDTGARELSHAFKRGSAEAMKEIALAMAPLVATGATLIPIPSRTGKAVGTLALAHEISKHTDATVVDALSGCARDSQYERKKLGRALVGADFEYRIGEVTQITRPVLIDIVYDTGATMTAAWEVIQSAEGLVFARVL